MPRRRRRDADKKFGSKEQLVAAWKRANLYISTTKDGSTERTGLGITPATEPSNDAAFQPSA